MWCSHCGQDVPGITPEGARFSKACARCGHLFSSEPAGVDRDGVASTELPPELRDLDWDEWDLDDSLEASDENESSPKADEPTDSPVPVRLTLHGPHTPVGSPLQHRRRGSPIAWFLLSFGIAVLMCGAILMMWSFVGQRTELWTVGTPLALCGQAMILVGLVFQMEILWQSSRETSRTLEEIDERITDLRRTTTLLHDSPARPFYRHMADGASPETLIDDLKGQLDLLTVKMHSGRPSNRRDV